MQEFFQSFKEKDSIEITSEDLDEARLILTDKPTYEGTPRRKDFKKAMDKSMQAYIGRNNTDALKNIFSAIKIGSVEVT